MPEHRCTSYDPDGVVRCNSYTGHHDRHFCVADNGDAEGQVMFWTTAEETRYDAAPAAGPLADWAGCCRASRRIWELVIAMYQRGDAKALAVAPTITCAEMIAAELGIEAPGTT